MSSIDVVEMEFDRFLNKKYKESKAENFEEFMKALGMNAIVRKIARFMNPVYEIRRDGDVYTFHVKVTFTSMSNDFKLGEEFEETRPDGTKVLNTITLDGNMMYHTQKYSNNKVVNMTREYKDDEMIEKSEVDGVECVKIFTVVA